MGDVILSRSLRPLLLTDRKTQKEQSYRIFHVAWRSCLESLAGSSNMFDKDQRWMQQMDQGIAQGGVTSVGIW